MSPGDPRPQGRPLAKIEQVSTYEDPARVAAWRKGSARLAVYLAGPTARMLDLAGIADGHRVLVIGAGTGGDALEAATRVGTAGEVVATDISTAMIAGAKVAVAEAKPANIRCLVMDAQRLDFAPETFDAVIARNALMFIPDLALALAEMRRVLKARGRVAATVWSAAGRNPRISALLDSVRALGITPPATAGLPMALRLGAPRLLGSALRQANFSNVVVERQPVLAHYDTLEEAVEAAMDQAATRELVRLLSDQSEASMRRSLARRWRRYTESSGVHLPGEQLVVAGTK